ncbi:tachykinins [Eurosta solidaginis]|uniref:tachykinins n=1 Tax=Eurosta solidaginis TaxID=178769 RepID=UPI003530D321
MAAQILKYTTVRCCKLLLLFLLLTEVASVNGTGSESPTHDEHNYPTVIKEWIKRHASTVDVGTTILPDDCKDENDNVGGGTDKHGIPLKIGNPLRALNIVKRTPNGFTGMRGKKEYEFTDNNNNKENMESLYGSDSVADWTIDPMQRQQMANHDDLNIAYNRLFGLGSRFKKATSTFYGVRGKKFTSSDLQRIDALLQRLEEDKLREVLQEDFLNYLVSQQQSLAQNDVNKRAPTGFTGMRGKRPAAGIIDYLYNGDDGTWPKPMLEEKRGPVNGFMGVRGKKEADHQAFKRSPVESPNRRSKAQRFVDFSNKFVAVRGKKANSECDNNSNTFNDETYHRYNNKNNNFPVMSQLSMRGKRALVMPAETDHASYELALEDSRNINNLK